MSAQDVELKKGKGVSSVDGMKHIQSEIPTPRPPLASTTHKECILKNSSGDIIVMLDYETGDLNLSGELKPWNDSLPENDSIRKFIIRSGNNNSTAVFIIDQEGNLYLKGLVYIHSLL